MSVVLAVKIRYLCTESSALTTYRVSYDNPHLNNLKKLEVSNLNICMYVYVCILYVHKLETFFVQYWKSIYTFSVTETLNVRLVSMYLKTTDVSRTLGIRHTD